MLQYLANKRHYQRFDLIDALVADNPTKIKLLSNSWARTSQTWEVLVMLLGNTFHPVATLSTFTQTTFSRHLLSYTSSPQGRATGNKPALWVRSRIQEELYQLGLLLQRHAGKVLFTGILLLATFTIGLKSVQMEDKIEKLWVEEGGRLDRELAYVEETLGPGSGGINQMLIQTGEGSSNLLTPESLLTHLQVLKKATRVTVEMDDV